MASGSSHLGKVFFTNLQLLGLDASSMEKSLKIPFNKDMFNLPNMKGFEVVMHFLFNKLDPVRCKSEFSLCWPITDKKSEARFRKICHSWLTIIAKEDAHFPTIVASMFLSPGGDKFCHLLLAFTRYVLLKRTCADYGVKSYEILTYPSVPSQAPQLAGVIKKAVMCGTVHYHQSLIQHTQQAVNTQDAWKTYAKELVKENRELSKRLREVKEEVEKERQILFKRAHRSSPGRNSRSPSRSVESCLTSLESQRSQRVQQVRDQWRQVADFCRCHDGDKEIVESLLSGEGDRYELDTADLKIRVPDILLRQCEKEIHRRNVENIYKGGKLNLVSLIHLWNLSLYLYIDNLHKMGVADFGEVEPALRSQLHRHQVHLNNTKSFIDHIENVFIPETKKKAAELRECLDLRLFPGRPSTELPSSKLGFGLMPATPPVNFDPTSTPTVSDPLLPRVVQRADPQVATPEAVSILSEVISNKVKSRHHQKEPVNHHHYPHKRVLKPSVEGERDKKDKPKSTRVSTPIHTAKQAKVKVGSKSSQAIPGSQHKPSQAIPGSVRSERGMPKLTGAPLASSAPLRQKLKLDSRKPVKLRTDKNRPVITSKLTMDAQSLLAEQIAEAVASGHTEGLPDQAILNPATSLDIEAFTHKDKLARTPPTKLQNLLQEQKSPITLQKSPSIKPKSPPTRPKSPPIREQTPPSKHKTPPHHHTPSSEMRTPWKEAPIEDSIGPLSSTRIEAPPPGADRPQADRVALRLFTDDNSDPTQTAVSHQTPSASTPSLLPARTPPVGSELASLSNTPSSIHSVTSHSPAKESPKPVDKTLVERNSPTLARIIDFDLEADSKWSLGEVDLKAGGVSQSLLQAEQVISEALSGLREITDSRTQSLVETPLDLVSATPKLPARSHRKVHGALPSPNGSFLRDLLSFDEKSEDLLTDTKEPGLLSWGGTGIDEIEPPIDLDQVDDEFQQFAMSAQTPKHLRERIALEEAETGGAGKTQQRLTEVRSSLHQRFLPDSPCSSVNPASSVDDTEDENVRVIEFQNGHFNEILDKSPAKTLEKEENKLRASGKLGLTQSLEAELDSWRKKGLVRSSLPSQSPNKLLSQSQHSSQSSVPTQADELDKFLAQFKSSESPVMAGHTVSSPSLQMSKTDEPAAIGVTSEPILTRERDHSRYFDLISGPSPGIGDGSSPAGDRVHAPTRRVRTSASFEINPLTYELHSNTPDNFEPLLDDQSQGILSEGDSLLVPSTPIKGSDQYVPTGKLLDL